MKNHFTILFAQPVSNVQDIIRPALLDPAVLYQVDLTGADPRHLLLFCANPAMAQLVATELERGRAMNPLLCKVIVSTTGIRVSVDCAEPSTAQLGVFVRSVLARYAPCRVVDDDSGDELTEQVARSPDILFH